MYDPERIWSSTQLPSLPTVAVDLLEISREDRAEVADVVRIVKTDPALTARVLRATNSSFFALRNEVQSIDRAAPLLGARFVIALALGFSLIDESLLNGRLGEHFRRYWLQSLVQASAAELLSETSRSGCKDQCFQAGLLLDIGQLAMLKTMGEDYLPVLDASEQEQVDLFQLEDQQFGFDHMTIGRNLAANWKLADPLQQFIQHHHQPPAELEEVAGDTDPATLKILAVASAVGDYFCRSYKGAALNRLRSLAESFFQFDDDRLDQYLELARQRFDICAEMFNVSSASVPSASELMAQANLQLSELTLQAQMQNAAVVQRQQEMESERITLEHQNQQLQKQVFRDALTKAYNRQFFDETLAKELQRCVRTKSAIGVIFCDVDHFKRLNDTFGHAFGDEVLQGVAGLLQETVRGCDTLARYGGEEFVILVCQPSEEGIERIGERIRERIADESFAHDGQAVQVTISLGAVITIPNRGDGEVAEELLKIADEQMYQAKRAGRNQLRLKSLLDQVQRRELQRQSAYLFSKWLLRKHAIGESTAAQAAQMAGQQQTPSAVAQALVQQGELNDGQAIRLLHEFNTQSVPPEEAVADHAVVG